MSIHQRIKSKREQKEWSHARLAEEVSLLEGRKNPLSWQAVQQWEQSTQPTHKRLPFVAKALGCSVAELVGEEPPVAQESSSASSAYSNAALVSRLGEIISAHNKTRRETLANLLFRFANDPDNRSIADELASLMNI